MDLNADIINLIIKYVLLLCLAVVSRLALEKRHYSLMFFTLTVFLTTFRLAVLRAVVIYIGVFKYQPIDEIKAIRDFFQSSEYSIAVDVLMLIALAWFFKDFRKHHIINKLDNRVKKR